MMPNVPGLCGLQGSGGLTRSMSGGQQHEDAHPACIESMDYSSSMRMLAVVFTDGRWAQAQQTTSLFNTSLPSPQLMLLS